MSVSLGKQTRPPLQHWGSERGFRGRRNVPFPLPLARESFEQGGGTDGFPVEAWPAALTRSPRAEVKVSEGQPQGFARGWRGHSRGHPAAAQGPCRAAPRSGPHSPRAPRRRPALAFLPLLRAALWPLPAPAATPGRQSGRLRRNLEPSVSIAPAFPVPFSRHRRRRLSFSLALSGL